MRLLDKIMTVAVVLVSAMHPAIADAQAAKELVGTWSLVSETYEQNGKTIQPYGPSPKGIQILGSDGQFAVIIVNPDLPKFASDNRVAGTAEENKAVVQGSLAYFGTYTVDDAGKTWSVQIEGATFPNWMGRSEKRTIAITGDVLTVSNPKASAGLAATLVWRRVK
jgi:Neuraminidase (sialidase)